MASASDRIPGICRPFDHYGMLHAQTAASRTSRKHELEEGSTKPGQEEDREVFTEFVVDWRSGSREERVGD